MTARLAALAALVAAPLFPAAAFAHVSLHPNAIPQGSFVTTDVRVPNEEANASITSVKVKLPEGVLSAQGQPPPGWTFTATTKKLAKPVKTDDGTVTTEVTEVAFTSGKTPPGEFVSFPVTFSVPDSAKRGDVLAFPTVQTYSNGSVVRWIGPAADEHPAPTVDITAPGTAVLDVTGGDAGPPPKLPAAATTIVKKESANKTLAIIALALAAVALGLSLSGRMRARGAAG